VSACNTSTVTPKTPITKIKEQKIITEKTDINSSKTKETTTSLPSLFDPKNIEGSYVLERGQISFRDIRKNINNSNLIIEKLDDDNFGFYYTVQVEEHVPDEYFGIFYYKDGKFVQKVIADGGDVSYYDNIELINEGDRLKLTIKTNQGNRIIIWKKEEDMIPSEELLKAEKSYNGICKAKYNELLLN
jgi:hypothetical protein